MKLKLYEFDMKLRYPFSISRHTYYSQPTIIIELQHENLSGFGEATINPYYNITIENLKESFKSIEKRLENYSFVHPDRLFSDFSDYLSINTFALGALNNASWDLYGKLTHSAVIDLIEMPGKKKPLTSYTLGIDTPDGLVKKLHELPWPIYKLKLGTPNDLELVQKIRECTDARIRVDANCAWNANRLVSISGELRSLDVEFIEQPLAAHDPEQNRCFIESALPLIADESCCIEPDVVACDNKFHGINIKLLKCGGLTPAIRMIKKARNLGLQIMVGCMTETTVGISAAAQLMPFVDYADLDGPLLLAEDVAEGLHFEYGNINLSGNHGLGIDFKRKT